MGFSLVTGRKRKEPENVADAEKGDSHHLPVAEGDTAPAEGRGLETNGGCHLFRSRFSGRAGAALGRRRKLAKL
jgi:hypothetical protein